LNQFTFAANKPVRDGVERGVNAVAAARAGNDRPALRQGINLTFGIGRGAERFATVEIRARYHWPSHAFFSMFACNVFACVSHSSAKILSPRRPARIENVSARRKEKMRARRFRLCLARRRDSCRRSNRRSPSSGRPCSPNFRPFLIARTQCS